MFHSGNRDDRVALGQSIRDYWAGFAYHGSPGSGRSSTQPAWPRWHGDEPLVMVLDGETDGGLRAEPIATTVEAVKSSLARSTDLPDRLRCALYVDLFLDNNGLPELYSAREYQALGCGQFPAWSLAGGSR